MFLTCSCGTTTSAFNPRCGVCGAPVVEEGAVSAPHSERREPLVVTPGKELGPYRIESTLGAGTLGRVFKAIRTHDGLEVALKVMHAHLLQDRDARHRFIEEARALSRVKHRFIGRILEAFEVDGAPVLALELYRGQSLRAILDRRGRFEATALLPILRALCEALGALHDAGWVHRDVKPENVLVLDHEAATPRDLRLLDFGLAKSLAPSNGATTAVGVFVGSPAYSAPEQVLGEAIGPAVDWWALGVTTYELLVGERPFGGGSRTELVRDILRSEPTLSRLDPRLVPWIQLLIAREPTSRPASWTQALSALEKSMGDLS